MSQAVHLHADRWMARHAEPLLPDLRGHADLLAALREKLLLPFQRTYPHEDLSQHLNQWLKKRSIKILQSAHAITATGDIDVDAYIKYVIGKNPRLLSQRSVDYGDDESIDRNKDGFLSDNQCFCHEICQMVRVVKGIDLSWIDLVPEIKSIQRHVLNPCDLSEMVSPPFLLPKDPLPAVLLYLLDPNKSESETEQLLFECSEALFRELSAIHLDDLLLAISSIIPIVTASPREVLWPDLLNQEAAVRELLTVFAQNSPSFSAAMNTLNDYLQLAHFLPPYVPPEYLDSLSQDPDLGIKYRSVLSYFKNDPTPIIRYLSRAKTLPWPPLNYLPQIYSIAASDNALISHFLPNYPMTVRFIRGCIEKRFVENPGIPIGNLAQLAKNTICALFNELHGQPIDSVSFKETQKKACKWTAKQGDMIWRAIILKHERIQIDSPLMNTSCQLFDRLQRMVLRFEHPHLPLNRDRILSEWTQEYLHDFPAMQRQADLVRRWGDQYLTFIWYAQGYNQTLSKYAQMSTIRMFIHDQVARIISESPNASQEEISVRVRACANRLLPHYPIDDYDIKEIAGQLVRTKHLIIQSRWV